MIDRFKNILRYHWHDLVHKEHDPRENSFQGEKYEFSSNQDKTASEAGKDAYSSTEREYYANLEIPVGSSFADIKLSYRKLMQRYHPDRFESDSIKRRIAEEVTIKLNQAYAYFKDKNV